VERCSFYHLPSNAGEGDAPGTVIFRLSGPLTARNMYASLTPAALRDLLDLESMPGGKLPALNIFDMTRVPYVDSMGMGMIVTHYVRCQNKGIRMIAAGVSPRVMELLRLTKVDTVLPMAATVAECN
jgi:anti-anti-sigma factor